MKKMFKKSIAMLIAVLMVISAMPFTAITAFAATGTLSNSGFTIAANGGTRWKNNQMNIVNDQGSDNTSLGIIKFDISSLKGKKIASAKLTFSIDDYNNDSQGLVFYYSPVCNATLNNKQTDDTGLKTVRVLMLIRKPLLGITLRQAMSLDMAKKILLLKI